MSRFQADVRLYVRTWRRRRNVTPVQLCIAWVGSLGNHVMARRMLCYPHALPSLTVFKRHPERTLENLTGGDVVLDETELQSINALIENADLEGGHGRYSEQHAKLLGA